MSSVGKDLKSNSVTVSMDEVRKLAQLVEETVKFIDKQVKDGLLEDDEHVGTG
ncbi:hypothetical protein [Polaromonas sp. UC242_47]|uniref:hypothetical protein n=1 Tax=Polaromonas sp. UC242_47 TaxID=3374626 RepID=UPI0037A53423